MDRPPPTSHIARRQTGFRADGTIREPIVVTDGGARRLHSGEQTTGGSPTTETSCAQKDSAGLSGSRGYARSVTILVLAAYAQGHGELRRRVS